MNNRCVYVKLNSKQLRYMRVKRYMGFLLACVGVVVMACPMAIIAIVSKVNEPKEKVLFKQQRVGKDGKIFYLYKFRTLSGVNEYKASHEINADDHASKWGKFLRKTSIDEVPQLLNILKGDMCFIGPRPLIPQEKYMHELRFRRGVYQVYPGLSGLAQINGRKKINSEKKVIYDSYYIKHYGLKIDVSLFFMSIWKVLKRDSV